MSGDWLDAAQVREHVEDLSFSLAWWARRDDTTAQPGARRAASAAVDAIDAALRELHQIRQQLITQIRRSDDAAAVRVDALLAERRAGGAR